MKAACFFQWGKGGIPAGAHPSLACPTYFQRMERMNMKAKQNGYADKLKDPRWQKLRLAVFERDGWACRICGAKDRTLNAHHTFYKRDAQGLWDYEPETIVTLCDACHEAEHEQFHDARENLFESLARAGIGISSKIFELSDALNNVGTGLSPTETDMVLFSVDSLLMSRNAHLSPEKYENTPFSPDEWRAVLRRFTKDQKEGG